LESWRRLSCGSPIMTRFLAIAALCAGSAAAQPASAPASMPSIPAATCTQPEYPGRLASEARKTAFTREYRAYGHSVKQYAADLRKLTDEAQAAGNRVVEEYNNFTKDLQAKVEAGKNGP